MSEIRVVPSNRSSMSSTLLSAKNCVSLEVAQPRDARTANTLASLKPDMPAPAIKNKLHEHLLEELGYLTMN